MNAAHSVHHVDFTKGVELGRTDYDQDGRIVGGYTTTDAIESRKEQPAGVWRRVLGSQRLQVLGGFVAAGALITYAVTGANEAALHPKEPTPAATLGPCREDVTTPAHFPAGSHTEICKLPGGALTRQLEITPQPPTHS